MLNSAFIIFVFWPREFALVEQLPLNENTQHLAISAHGVKDNAASWSDPLQAQLASLNLSSKQSQFISLDWQEYADNALSCSVFGKQLGYQIGQRLVAQTQLEVLHLIGHSCGSFVVLGLCQAVKKFKPSVKIQTTYLDPVSVYGGFWWQYGLEHFGRCGDISDSFIDTSDTVPGSNQNLPHSITFDVTQVKFISPNQHAPHNWPTQYYLRQVQKGEFISILDEQDNAKLVDYRKLSKKQLLLR